MTDLLPDNFQNQIAEAVGKETAKQAFGFINDILRPPAKELGGLLADKIKYFRLKTQIKIICRASELHKKLGIESQKVPLKLLSNLVDHCSWEENEDIQNKWANLLSNMSTEKENTDNYSMHIELLRQFSPIQAKCLDWMYNEENWPARRLHRSLPSYQSSNLLQKRFNLKDLDLFILIDSLVRLNLIHAPLEHEENKISVRNTEIEKKYDEISLTFLGQDLVKKCRVPFTKYHIEKIKNLLSSSIVNIAKDCDGKEFKSFAEGVKDIYEYADESYVKSAVWQALRAFLWKDNKMINYDESKHGALKKTEIIDAAIDYFCKVFL